MNNIKYLYVMSKLKLLNLELNKTYKFDFDDKRREDLCLKLKNTTLSNKTGFILSREIMHFTWDTPKDLKNAFKDRIDSDGFFIYVDETNSNLKLELRHYKEFFEEQKEKYEELKRSGHYD